MHGNKTGRGGILVDPRSRRVPGIEMVLFSVHLPTLCIDMAFGVPYRMHSLDTVEGIYLLALQGSVFTVP